MSNNNNFQVVQPGNNRRGDRGEKFDLKAFLSRLWANWLVFIISISVCILLAALFVYYIAPAYYINATVLIDDGDDNSSSAVSGVSSSELDLSSLLDLKNNVDNEVQVLMTKQLMREAINDLNANVIYFQYRHVTDVEIYNNPFIVTIVAPIDTILKTTFYISLTKDNKFNLSYRDQTVGIVLHPSTSLNNLSFGQEFKANGVGMLKVTTNPKYKFMSNDYRFDIESVDQRVYDFQNVLLVSTISTEVSTININFAYPTSKKGEDIITSLINDYIAQNKRMNDRVADSTIKFIDNRLVLVSHELDSIEHNIQNFKEDNKLADLKEQGTLLLNNTSTYQDEIAKNNIQLNICSSLLDYLNDETKNKTVVPVSVLPDDPIFALLVNTYNSLLVEQDKQAMTITPDNPYMQNLTQRIATVRKDMIKNLQTTQKSLKITDEQLKQSTSGFQNQIAAVPPQERVFLDLSRNQNIAQTLYIFLLQKKEETEISKTSTLSIATVIDPAKADYKPYFPNLVIVFGMAIFMGLIFPVARLYILDAMNNRILTREDITSMCSVPIIGEISHNTSSENLIVLSSARSAISEQMRALRTNLNYFMNKENEKVILVTSSMSGEGKSFISVNLATVLAISGKKVLIMELDLRKPKISSYFGIDNTNGFSNYIVSKDIPLSSIINNSVFHENLYVISSGPIPPNPSELIMDDRTTAMIEKLKADFDYIIIDAPPVGIITDAQLMSRFTDMSLYIVRQNYTLKEQLNIPEDIYKNNRMKNLSLIVNDILVTKGYGYNYGYGYGYGYGYYLEDDKQKGVFSRLASRFKKT